jgi:hypothetical protein
MPELKLAPGLYDPAGGRSTPTLSPKQQRLLWYLIEKAIEFEKKERERRVLHIGCFGEWGGGKTLIAMILFFVLCLINSDPSVTDPDQLPASGLWAATLDDMKRGPKLHLLELAPEEFVRDHTDKYIEWEFGHRTWLYSADKSADGPNLTHVMADEFQKPVYAVKWRNIKARARSNRAKVNAAIAAGLAERGHVEDYFRVKVAKDGLYYVEMLYPEDNPANPPGYADEIRAMSAGSRERDPEGWLMPTGVRYPKISTVENIQRAGELYPDLAAIFGRPTSLGIDLGRKAVVAFLQDEPIECNVGSKGVRKEVGGLLVDQLILDDLDAEGVAKAIADYLKRPIAKGGRHWNIMPGVSRIAIDPTAVPEQLDHFRRKFPGVEIVQITAGMYREEEHGCRAVDRALCDAHGNRRLLIHPSLIGRHERGVPESLRGWRVEKPKDKKFEHACDAVRYIVQVKLPLPERPIVPPSIKPSELLAQVLDPWSL